MATDDWYRGTAWDDTARHEFERRLSRARGQRAQYLLVKGSALTHAEERAVRDAGRDLLGRMLSEHPDEPVSVIRAQHALGVAYARDQLYGQAAEHLEAALRMRDEGLSVDTGSALALAEVIQAANWSHRFEEAMAWLDRYWKAGSPFPAANFRALLTGARIANRTGHPERARELADQALGLLADNKSPFPHHRGVGLIHTDEKTFRELERLAR